MGRRSKSRSLKRKGMVGVRATATTTTTIAAGDAPQHHHHHHHVEVCYNCTCVPPPAAMGSRRSGPGGGGGGNGNSSSSNTGSSRSACVFEEATDENDSEDNVCENENRGPGRVPPLLKEAEEESLENFSKRKRKRKRRAMKLAEIKGTLHEENSGHAEKPLENKSKNISLEPIPEEPLLEVKAALQGCAMTRELVEDSFRKSHKFCQMDHQVQTYAFDNVLRMIEHCPGHRHSCGEACTWKVMKNESDLMETKAQHAQQVAKEVPGPSKSRATILGKEIFGGELEFVELSSSDEENDETTPYDGRPRRNRSQLKRKAEDDVMNLYTSSEAATPGDSGDSSNSSDECKMTKSELEEEETMRRRLGRPNFFCGSSSEIAAKSIGDGFGYLVENRHELCAPVLTQENQDEDRNAGPAVFEMWPKYKNECPTNDSNNGSQLKEEKGENEQVKGVVAGLVDSVCEANGVKNNLKDASKMEDTQVQCLTNDEVKNREADTGFNRAGPGGNGEVFPPEEDLHDGKESEASGSGEIPQPLNRSKGLENLKDAISLEVLYEVVNKKTSLSSITTNTIKVSNDDLTPGQLMESMKAQMRDLTISSDLKDQEPIEEEDKIESESDNTDDDNLKLQDVPLDDKGKDSEKTKEEEVGGSASTKKKKPGLVRRFLNLFRK